MRDMIHLSYRKSSCVYSNYASVVIYTTYNLQYIYEAKDIHSKYNDIVKSNTSNRNLNVENKFKNKFYKN